MSRELKSLSEEVKSSESTPNANSKINDSISNLKSIVNDLYEGFIEKITILDFEEENGLLPIDDELDTDVQERKKALLKVLEEEVEDEGDDDEEE